jgi:hypothetical protein
MDGINGLPGLEMNVITFVPCGKEEERLASTQQVRDN